jgi:hypothetical protein
MNMNNAIFGELNDGYAGIGKPLTIGTFDLYTTEVSEADILTIYTNEVSRFAPPLPPVTGLSNGRRFGQGFPQ